MLFGTKNTANKGAVRYVIFNDGDSWYGVALEFNLVVDAETPQGVYFDLLSSVRSYIDTVKNGHIRNSVLNQNTSSEYSKLWKDLQDGKPVSLKSISNSDFNGADNTSIEVNSYGFLPQAA